MEGEKFQQLGQLYARTGIATPAEVLEMRRNAALKVYEQLEEEHLVRLLRGCFGTTKPDELEFVTLALAQHDPSYDPVSGIREAQVVCCAMLREALGDSDSFAGAAALGTPAPGPDRGAGQRPPAPSRDAPAARCSSRGRARRSAASSRESPRSVRRRSCS